MAYFLFFLIAGLCVGSILAMIIIKNQAYNALLLILAFACTGALFAFLDAPFIAVVQIIIYAGAIMVLFIFVIMTINLRRGLPPEKKKWIPYLSIGIGAVLIVELILVLKTALKPVDTAGIEKMGSPSEIGTLLFTKYLYPFEITSVLIIAALVGAIVLVKKKEGE